MVEILLDVSHYLVVNVLLPCLVDVWSMIVGISGKARNGKNTLGLFLAMRLKALGVTSTQLAFAHRLKKDAILMGWNGEKDLVGRFALQKYGELMRELDKDYWINALGKSNPEIRNDVGLWIITDVRYKNEAEWIRKNEGVLIRIERVGIDKPGREHISETDLDIWTDWDWMVSANDGDLQEIWDMAGRIAEWICYRM